jgi:hypothetical protein
VGGESERNTCISETSNPRTMVFPNQQYSRIQAATLRSLRRPGCSLFKVALAAYGRPSLHNEGRLSAVTSLYRQ